MGRVGLEPTTLALRAPCAASCASGPGEMLLSSPINAEMVCRGVDPLHDDIPRICCSSQFDGTDAMFEMVLAVAGSRRLDESLMDMPPESIIPAICFYSLILKPSVF